MYVCLAYSNILHIGYEYITEMHGRCDGQDPCMDCYHCIHFCRTLKNAEKNTLAKQALKLECMAQVRPRAHVGFCGVSNI